MKLIEMKEFREKGYLLEINRIFLHPLGLALTITVNEKEEEESLLGIVDHRDDPEGIIFADSIICDPQMLELSKLVEKDKMHEIQKFETVLEKKEII